MASLGIRKDYEDVMNWNGGRLLVGGHRPRWESSFTSNDWYSITSWRGTNEEDANHTGEALCQTIMLLLLIKRCASKKKTTLYDTTTDGSKHPILANTLSQERSCPYTPTPPTLPPILGNTFILPRSCRYFNQTISYEPASITSSPNSSRFDRPSPPF